MRGEGDRRSALVGHRGNHRTKKTTKTCRAARRHHNLLWADDERTAPSTNTPGGTFQQQPPPHLHAPLSLTSPSLSQPTVITIRYFDGPHHSHRLHRQTTFSSLEATLNKVTIDNITPFLRRCPSLAKLLRRGHTVKEAREGSRQRQRTPQETASSSSMVPHSIYSGRLPSP